MPSNHQQLYRFHRWANRTILEACRDLTPEQLSGFGGEWVLVADAIRDPLAGDG